MASLARIRCVWTGFVGAPGYTNLYVANPETQSPQIASVRTFFDAIKAHLPTTVTVQVENAGPIISDLDGEQFGDWSATAVASVTGTSSSVYNAPAGGAITWNTSKFIRGRRLKGRSYLVPMAGYSDADGSISAAALLVLQNAASAMVTAMSPNLAVWSRPIKTGTPPVITTQGDHGVVTGRSVADKVAVLRSRRD
jgi:hypothetical protein